MKDGGIKEISNRLKELSLERQRIEREQLRLVERLQGLAVSDGGSSGGSSSAGSGEDTFREGERVYILNPRLGAFSFENRAATVRNITRNIAGEVTRVYIVTDTSRRTWRIPTNLRRLRSDEERRRR